MRLYVHSPRILAAVVLSVVGPGLIVLSGATGSDPSPAKPIPAPAAKVPDEKQPMSGAQPGRVIARHVVDVSLSPNGHNGHIESREKQGDTSILHGFQAKTGPDLTIKEYSIYDRGHCGILVQFYPNGDTFRSQHREKNGDGSDTVYSAKRTKVLAKGLKVDGGVIDVIVQDEVCSGRVKAGLCWDGTFLVPGRAGFANVLELHEYKVGKLQSNVPFPLDKIGLPADANVNDTVNKWRWTFPAWPKVPKN